MVTRARCTPIEKQTRSERTQAENMSNIDYDGERLEISNRTGQTSGIIEEDPAIDNVEYVLSSQEDGMVAYRIVSMSDDDTKPSIVHAANETAAMPQQLQYIVIDNVNGYLQAVPTQTSITASTTASISSNSTTSSACMPVSTSRPSVTIAPKTVKTEANKYAHVAPIASTKQSINVAANKAISVFKKRDDRRRATHNEVERRRRDKINHWIMKLGSIIPADGSIVEIGDSGRVSIANVEGQSKGGILSKACEYVQMLQEKRAEENQCLPKSTNDKNAYEEEIARLRGENELLKAILIKNGINYAKERSSFKSEEYS